MPNQSPKAWQKSYDEVVAERDALAAQVGALKVDAERYRYLRNKTSADQGSRGRHYFRMPLPMPLNNPFKGSVAQHLDDAIDAARAGKEV